MGRLFAILFAFAITGTAHATFIDESKIRYELLSFGPSNTTKEEFKALIGKIEDVYAPVFRKHSATLSIDGDWDNGTPNAYASQDGSSWNVMLTGGLARRPELTIDGFTLVICHEIGHHLAGFSFAESFFGGDVWAANEGQSDYYSTHVCAHKIWGAEATKNAEYRDQVEMFAKTQCDSVWSKQEERDLCYRTSVASHSIGATLAALTGSKTVPSFDTPDANVVDVTDDNHPLPQCRVDTTFQGALCDMAFDDNLIPGKQMRNPFGTDSEKESAGKTCHTYSGKKIGLRPRCWFKARI